MMCDEKGGARVQSGDLTGKEKDAEPEAEPAWCESCERRDQDVQGEWFLSRRKCN